MHKTMKNSRQPEQLFVPDNTHLGTTYDVNSRNKDTQVKLEWWYGSVVSEIVLGYVTRKRSSKPGVVCEDYEIYEKIMFLMEFPCDL